MAKALKIAGGKVSLENEDVGVEGARERQTVTPLRVVGDPAEEIGHEAEDTEEEGEDAKGGKKRVRARTISIKRLSKRELERGRYLFPDLDVPKPVSRGDCLDGMNSERPCPFVSCRHHLFLDVNDRTGSIKLNFPDREVWELSETCALDIADRGGITLEEVGAIMNLTRERIRQLETRSLYRLQGLSEVANLSVYSE